MNKIQITGNDENKDNAMGSLNNQSTTFHCLADEVYVVTDEAVEKLEEDKIEFVRLDYGNKIFHNAKISKGERKDVN